MSVTTTAEISRTAIEAGHCYDDNARLHSLPDWLSCTECGRRFRIEGAEVVERIPVLPIAGLSVIAAAGRYVLLSGDVVDYDGVSDTFTIPDDAVFMEARW